MGDIQTRPFSKDYSGLINQSVIGLGLAIVTITTQELFKRRRRGKIPLKSQKGLGSRETWNFGYLYNGRSWARYPSPPSPTRFPLSWIPQVLKISEDEMNKLRGIDATLYIRFLRGCFWFAVLHALTTFPILFPIHVEFSSPDIPSKSMTRASISSLVGTAKGRSLLWVHIVLLFYITLSWMGTLIWVCNGAFRLRDVNIAATAERMAQELTREDARYYPHPHPQYGFTEVPSPDRNHPNIGLRSRTVMVSSVPISLRSEKELREYFQYYMSRKLEKPSMGLPSSVQPGFLNKSFAFLFNRAKRIPEILPLHAERDAAGNITGDKAQDQPQDNVPMIERVVIARKMTELASLLERREDTLRLLETAHIKLATKTLTAVKEAMDRQKEGKPLSRSSSKQAEVSKGRRSAEGDPEAGAEENEEERLKLLIDALGPYIEKFELTTPSQSRSKMITAVSSKYAFKKLQMHAPESDDEATPRTRNPHPVNDKTIWEALLDLPRHLLDPYQPLISLSHLFNGKTVPAIDYYTTKMNLLTSLITENRAKPVTDFEPVSTAFVTFENPADARHACKYLAVHPGNPLACLVTMAPMYQDVDWIRVMKSSLEVEFVKDWVVNIGVWGFTIFWLFPVSLLVGLVSIQNISLFVPHLNTYLEKHPWESEVIQSFLPTLLVSLLALLIPLILLLIAKKAHTITTLSELHDRMMTRYYKFLIVNVLLFFCVGTAALQSVLLSLKSGAVSRPDIIQLVADSYPVAGPFYVGWLIFTTAMHNGLEIALLGLPLILYPKTKRQVTPRKRAVGIRPRTLNYYYWLPNHLLVLHVLLLFATLNPVVLPFGVVYFFVASGVIKNQLIHVYAKNYETNGQWLLIRMIRFSLDGLILTQAVFLAYMVVLEKKVNVALSAFLIVFTATIKILMTRMCRAQFELDDIREAEILTGRHHGPNSEAEPVEGVISPENPTPKKKGRLKKFRSRPSKSTWRLPAWVSFSYDDIQHKAIYSDRRKPIPFASANQLNARHKSPSRDVLNLSQPICVTSEEQPGVIQYCHRPRRLDNIEENVVATADPSMPVIPHPPPLPWDDQTTVDLPYDNPFYTRDISNALWLPRNPCGVLDLDDTVDLRTSLTVEPSSGHLGSWLAESPRPMESPQPDSPVLQQSSTQLTPSESQFDGTEEIDLPPAIARRAHAKRGVDFTAQPRRPASYSRRINAGERSAFQQTLKQKPGILDESRRPSLSQYRSFSYSLSKYSGQSMATSQPRTVSGRSYSAGNGSGVRSDYPRSDGLPASTSRTSLTPGSPSRSNISAQEAIVHEVLAEEETALASLIEEEEAKASKAKSNRSWLTSWMFRRRH